jgi:hypothetical protein
MCFMCVFIFIAPVQVERHEVQNLQSLWSHKRACMGLDMVSGMLPHQSLRAFTCELTTLVGISINADIVPWAVHAPSVFP